MEDTRTPHLKRPANPWPEPVRKALELRGLTEAYERRPPYQRNDYLGWIGRAKRAGVTRDAGVNPAVG